MGSGTLSGGSLGSGGRSPTFTSGGSSCHLRTPGGDSGGSGKSISSSLLQQQMWLLLEYCDMGSLQVRRPSDSPFHPLGLNAGLISTCTGPFIVNCYVSRAYDEHMGSSAGVYLFLSGQLLKSPSYRWRGQAIMWLMNCSSSFSFGTTGLALPAIKDHLCSCKPTLPNQNI